MKKLRKLFAVLLAVCMMMSLLSVSASAEESHAEENALFKCEFASEHTHTGVDGTCYETQLVCPKHEHAGDCYTDGVLTCTKGVVDEAPICGFAYEHVHKEECKHVHDASKCGYGCEGLCAITEDGHDCTEKECHVAHSAECGYGCRKTEGETLDCGYEEEHTHIAIDAAAENEDPCYQYHVHVGETEAKDCYGRVLTCKTPEHTHVRGCLTDKAEATVKAVEILIAGDEERGIAATPSLAEMKAARTTQFVVGEEEGNYATANDASDAFDVYIEASFTARETAQAAYNAMPDELKPFVSEEILKRLTDTLDTWFLDKANSPTATTDEYTWYLGSGIRYESSAHFNSGGGWCQPYIFIDTTKYGGKTWKPDTSCEYSPGISNYEVAYCCDVDTGARNTTLYKRINLEDAEYYSEAAAQKIRAIVMNSYPFVTVDEMRENLVILGMNKDFVATLDRSDMIAAVQWAVWSQANGDDAWLTYSYTRGGGPDRNNVTIHQYANELWYWWGKDYVNQNAKYKTETLAGFLANLNGVALKDDQVVIDSLNLAGAPVLLKDGAYEVALKITLNSGGSSEKDNLTIKVTAGESTETIPVKHGTKEYVVTITVANNTEIKAEVIGTQHLPSGVYFYEPKPVDRNGDGIATTREASQNMVGVAMGDTAVYAEDSMLFEMEVPENPVAASLELKKVNETGEPLANAEFTLSTDLDNDGKVDSFATYTTDTNGEAVIEGLMAGKTYQLTETKAPAGYDPITGEIEFTVEQNEDLSLDMIFNLPNGATCNTPEDEQYILTVVNCETPSGGGGGGGGGGRDPEPDPDPEVTIPEEEPPLASLPDEDPPLAMLPEEDVPLALLPMTGDASALWMVLSALSGAGLFVTRKKRDEV